MYHLCDHTAILNASSTSALGLGTHIHERSEGKVDAGEANGSVTEALGLGISKRYQIFS